MTATASRKLVGGEPVIERASPSDRAFLAMDTGEVPEQFGVILTLAEASGFDLARARRLFVVTVPVSGRRPESGPALGNMVSPMLVSVPAAGDVADRLQQVAAQVRTHKAAAAGPPPIALLGWLFRPLAALGGYRWYMNHQHRFHTLVTHVRGPSEPVRFGGSPVTSAIPVGLGPGGNIPVYFEVLSYAGTLTLTATVDPSHFRDLSVLTDALRAELDLIIHHPAVRR
jgi:diacylglycerol O-acyltransferase